MFKFRSNHFLLLPEAFAAESTAARFRAAERLLTGAGGVRRVAVGAVEAVQAGTDVGSP